MYLVQEARAVRRPALCLGVRCRRLVTASIAGETAPATACSLAWKAGASTRLPRGPRSETGLGGCSHAASGTGSCGDDRPGLAHSEGLEPPTLTDPQAWANCPELSRTGCLLERYSRRYPGQRIRRLSASNHQCCCAWFAAAVYTVRDMAERSPGNRHRKRRLSG
jgi:hypothetical protein